MDYEILSFEDESTNQTYHDVRLGGKTVKRFPTLGEAERYREYLWAQLLMDATKTHDVWGKEENHQASEENLTNPAMNI